MRALRVLLATTAVLLAAPAAALAHGDGPSHYLESYMLYPGFSPSPSQPVELQLMGYVAAIDKTDYPVKIGLANEGDVTDRPEILRTPQAYAESVVSIIGHQQLKGPVVIVTPSGVGVAGWERRGGKLRKIDTAAGRRLARGIQLPLHPTSDAMAKAAMETVRQVSKAGGAPLPADIPPARIQLPPASTPSGTSGGGSSFAGWLPIGVFLAVFAAAGLGFEVRARIQRRRGRLNPMTTPN